MPGGINIAIMSKGQIPANLFHAYPLPPLSLMLFPEFLFQLIVLLLSVVDKHSETDRTL